MNTKLGNKKFKLPIELGNSVIKNGIRLGESDRIKDCYWSGYKHENSHYLSLNDDEYHVWLVNYQDIIDYINV